MTGTADDVPGDTHGLTAREYRLMEVIVESENSTIPALVAQGLTDVRLRSLTDQVLAQSGPGCAQAAKVAGGFDNTTFKASFIAGYIATAKVTPDAAGKVYDALAVYCTSS